MEISNNLKEKYKNHYLNSDSYWRLLGAEIKADNILELLIDFKPNKLAEIGAGDGSILYWLDKSEICSQMHAIEISDSAIDKIKEKDLKNVVNITKYDGYNIPFDDLYFDLVICSHVIEHVEYPRQLLREIKRVSKLQVFEIPIDFSFNTSKKLSHFLSYGHINIYTPDLFKFLLLSEGFCVIKDKKSMYPFKLLRLLYRNNSIKLFLSLIKALVFKTFWFLKQIKPNSYTVLSKSGDKKLEIF